MNGSTEVLNHYTANKNKETIEYDLLPFQHYQLTMQVKSLKDNVEDSLNINICKY